MTVRYGSEADCHANQSEVYWVTANAFPEFDVKDPEPQSDIVFDPVYVERVTAEIVRVIGEAQSMVAAGNIGPDLLDLARHAKELHDILTEQLIEAPDTILQKFGPIGAAIGRGIEGLLAQAEGRSPGPASTVQ